MFVLDDVSDEFVLDVVNTFEAMFPQNSDTIDLSSQKLILQNMQDYKHFKRGDILKAAGYNKSDLNAPRGNVLEGNYHIQWTGPLYLK